MFDFNDPAKDLKGKEIKRQALQDLLEYVATTRRVITDTIYPDVIRMVNMHTHTNKKNMHMHGMFPWWHPLTLFLYVPM